jgi:hypothetical protein
VLFFFMAAWQLYHTLVQRVPWPGYTLAANDVSYPLAAIWIAATAALWLRGAWSVPFLLLGVFATLVHGFFLALGGSSARFFFFAAAAVEAFLVSKSYSGAGRSRHGTVTGLITFPSEPEPREQTDKRAV